MQKKLRFLVSGLFLSCIHFGVRTAVWPPLLLFSGAHIRQKPSNMSTLSLITASLENGGGDPKRCSLVVI